MPESSVGGVFEIVSWIDGLATLASARNVVSRFTNSCACVLATGATIRAARSSAGKRSRSLVRESARFAATGWRLPNSVGNSEITAFRSSPRPARPFPKPTRLPRIPSRVRWSKVFSTSSISTGRGVARVSGIVSPGRYPTDDVPGVSCTYLRPSAERERMRMVLSMGSGWTLLSSFIVRIAIAPPPRCRTGLTESTAPTRWPPIRTSLPGTRFAALGTWALSS